MTSHRASTSSTACPSPRSSFAIRSVCCRHSIASSGVQLESTLYNSRTGGRDPCNSLMLHLLKYRHLEMPPTAPGASGDAPGINHQPVAIAIEIGQDGCALIAAAFV